MKRLTSIITLITILCFICSGCTNSDKAINPEDAKRAVTDYCEDAMISDCTLNPDGNTYTINFSTPYAEYICHINAKTGKIISITLKEENQSLPATEFENEEETENAVSFISTDTALSIAISDSGASGTAIIVKNALDREAKIFHVVFRSGEFEYSYLIDAVTGEIISSEIISNP